MRKHLLLALLLLSVSPVRAAERVPKYVLKPFVMSIMVGGFDGRSYEVTYDGRELRYYAANNMFVLAATPSVVLKPTDAQWQAFYDDLDRLKVWRWKRRYTNPNILDGTVWRAVISYETRDTRDLISSGSNAYPGEYAAFKAALQRLLGGRKFE